MFRYGSAKLQRFSETKMIHDAKAGTNATRLQKIVTKLDSDFPDKIFPVFFTEHKDEWLSILLYNPCRYFGM